MKENNKKTTFIFTKNDYMLMVGGLLIALIGYLLMIGGGSDDPNVFNPEVFSFRRITLAPLIVLAGYGVVLYAILKKPKEQASEK